MNFYASVIPTSFDFIRFCIYCLSSSYHIMVLSHTQKGLLLDWEASKLSLKLGVSETSKITKAPSLIAKG